MKTSENYQQQAPGNKEQTVIMDPVLTAETDELNPAFEAEGLSGPEDDDNEDEDDDDFPAREDLEYDGDDQGLDQDDENDPDFNNDEEEEDFY